MKQFSLFTQPQEKGRAEWRTFDAVRDDRPGVFRVAKPVEERIGRGSVVAVRTYRTPHKLFPKPAH